MMNLIKNVCTLIFVSLVPSSIFGQIDSVNHWRQVGIDRHEQANYQGAINAFEIARTFEGNEEVKDINELSKLSYEAYVNQLKIAEKKARDQAIHSLANEIALKAKETLKDGDRSMALRLAEFTHQFIEKDNPSANDALIKAYYYNDHFRRVPGN